MCASIIKKYLIVYGLFNCLLLTSCTHYRVVELYEVVKSDGSGEKTTFYAIAKNNIIIPELVVDKNGNYPSSKKEAWRRLEERKEVLDEDINIKYKIPHNVPYQMKRSGLMIGLIAVSPVVIPITYFSELMSPDEDKKDGVSFCKVVKDYFSISVNEPISYYPPLKDEFKIVNIDT